jgi:hypothetical protein
MRWVVLAALLVGGCDESFESPPTPDLYKPPLDFAAPGPSRDGGGKDLGMPDLAGGSDQGMPDDLSAPLDFTLVGDHDLSQTD